MRRTIYLTLLALVGLTLWTCAKSSGDGGGARAAAYEPTAELEIDIETRRKLLDYARAVWTGQEGKPADTGVATSRGNPLILGLYTRKGTLLATHRVDDPTTDLNAKVREAVARARKKGLSDAFRGSPDKDIFLHLNVVTYTARLPNFGVKGLFKNGVYVPRVTGLVFELDGERHELDPMQTMYRNMNAKHARKALERRSGIGEGAMNRRNDLTIEIYRVAHFGERYPDKRFTEFHRGHEVFTHEQVDEAAVRRSLKLIGQWYRNNVIDGEVTYQYGVFSRTYFNEKRTMVRSTMAVWILNRLATFLKDDELRELGEETLRFYFERYYQMGKSLAAGRIVPSEKPTQKGEVARNRYSTAGFLAAAVLERGELERYRREVDLLTTWLMGHQRADGVMKTQFAQSQYFMPGQVMLCAAYVWEATGDPRYRAFVDAIFEAYAPALDAMMHLGDPRYGPIAPAWFTQPFTVMYRATKDPRYRDQIFAINDRVAQWYDLNRAFASYFDYDGVLAPKPGYSGNNSITAASLESLIDGYQVAKLDGDTERAKRYSTVARRTIAYLLRLQYTPANSYYVRNRKRVVGGFKQDLANNLVWMDNVWHLTSAFIKAIEYGMLKEG